MKQLFTRLTYLVLLCFCLSVILEMYDGGDVTINSVKLATTLFSIFILRLRTFINTSSAFVIFGILGFLTLPITSKSESYFQVLGVDLLEHALIIVLPFIVYLWKSGIFNTEKSLNYLRVAFGITFIGHGIYASGLVVAPTQFIYILSFFSNSKELNDLALYFIFASDIIVGVGLIVHFYEWKLLLYYSFFWVAVVTLARFFSFFPKEVNFINLLDFFSIIAWRVIYILLPLVLIKKK